MGYVFLHFIYTQATTNNLIIQFIFMNETWTSQQRKVNNRFRNVIKTLIAISKLVNLALILVNVQHYYYYYYYYGCQKSFSFSVIVMIVRRTRFSTAGDRAFPIARENIFHPNIFLALTQHLSYKLWEQAWRDKPSALYAMYRCGCRVWVGRVPMFRLAGFAAHQIISDH